MSGRDKVMVRRNAEMPTKSMSGRSMIAVAWPECKQVVFRATVAYQLDK